MNCVSFFETIEKIGKGNISMCVVLSVALNVSIRIQDDD